MPEAAGGEDDIFVFGQEDIGGGGERADVEAEAENEGVEKAAGWPAADSAIADRH